MIRGERVLLRPVRDEDLPTFERWAQARDALWGPFQRFQLDPPFQLHEAFRKGGLLQRDMAILLIETLEDPKVIGFVSYTLRGYPDHDLPYPNIGYAICDLDSRGKGYATEAVGLLVDYLFSRFPTERVAAFTDVENVPSQRVLERLGFRREGVLRHAYFRDGRFGDFALYGILRDEWNQK